MKLQIKKIIAREFLILTIVIVIGLIAFLGTFPYNYYNHSQIEKLSLIIISKTNHADSLSKSFDLKDEKQRWFFKMFIGNISDTSQYPYNTKEKLWKLTDYLARVDSIKIKFGKIWSKELIDIFKSMGFFSPEVFHKFIESNRINSLDLDNKKQAKKIIKEISLLKDRKSKYENNILSYYQQIYFGIWMLILSSILFFILRYLLYAIKWSIKILNN
ncbi:MAG: hypothetical protein Q8880_10340 [Bacteroidota bacterium]|nr:hypothetical protein [Bacteroidota bacterium]